MSGDIDRAAVARRRAPWRVGRKLERTIYEQVFVDEADDSDRLLGIMDDPRDAALVVALHNAHPDVLRSGPRPRPLPRVNLPTLSAEVSLLLSRRPDLTAADRAYLVEVVGAFERWRRASAAREGS